MSDRPNIPEPVKLELFKNSRRRCCICFALHNNHDRKSGQIAHADGNRSNNNPDNLVWLCLEHHDEYDSKTSQSKGIQKNELKHYRAELYEWIKSNFTAASSATGLEDLVERVNKLQSCLDSMADPLESIGGEIGLSREGFRDLLVEAARFIGVSGIAPIDEIRTLNAAGRHVEAIKKASLQIANLTKKTSSDNALRAAAYVQESLAYTHIRDYTSSMDSIGKAFSLLNESSSSDAWIEAYQARGFTAILSGDIELAMSSHLQILKLKTEKQIPLVFEDFFNLGYVYLTAGHVHEAEKMYVRSFNLANDFERNDIRVAIVLHSLALTQQELGNYFKAEDISRRCLGVLKDSERLQQLPAIAGFYTLAKILRLRQKYEEAMNFYQQSLDLSLKLLGEAHPQVAMTYNDMALCLMGLSEFDKAEKLLIIAIKLADNHNQDEFSKTAFLANKGRLRLMQELPCEAKICFEEAKRRRIRVLGHEHKLVVDMSDLLLRTEELIKRKGNK